MSIFRSLFRQVGVRVPEFPFGLFSRYRGPTSVTRLAHETVGVHAPFEQHGRVPHVVRRHQPVAVVHAGRVHGVPVDHAQFRAGLALEPQLHHRLVHVVLVPAKRTVGVCRDFRCFRTVFQIRFSVNTFRVVSFFVPPIDRLSRKRQRVARTTGRNIRSPFTVRPPSVTPNPLCATRGSRDYFA